MVFRKVQSFFLNIFYGPQIYLTKEDFMEPESWHPDYQYIEIKIPLFKEEGI